MIKRIGGLVERRVTTTVMFLAIALTLTACGGGGSNDNGGGAPAAPLAGMVVASGSGPANTVNAANAAALTITLDMPGSSRAEHQVRLAIADSNPANAAVERTSNSRDGNGPLDIGPFDVTGLDDGELSITAEVTGAAGSSGAVMIGTLQKDSVLVSGVTSVQVLPLPAGVTASGMAVTNVFNQVNTASASLGLVFDADSRGTNQFRVSLIDANSAQVDVAAQSCPEGAANIQVDNIDASSLADGTVVLMVTVSDSAGNEVTVPPVSLLKDTQLSQPSASYVLATASNPQDFVNSASATQTSVQVDFAAPRDVTDEIVVKASDGVSTLTFSSAKDSQVVTASAQALTFEVLDLSSLNDGPVTLEVILGDAAGNRSSFAGTAATLDRVIGSTTSVSVDAGASNDAGVINAASQAQVMLTVGLDAQAIAGDIVTVTLTDSSAQSVSATGTVGSAASLTVGPVDVTSLSDSNLVLSAQLGDAAGNSSGASTGSALKVTALPASPLSVVVSAGPNPQNVVNAASVATATIVVTARDSVMAGSTLSISATDGTHSLSASEVLGNGVTTMSFPELDFTSFDEGSFMVEAFVTDSYGNQGTSLNITALKDTVAPASIGLHTIIATANNPEGYVNAASQGAVEITIPVPMPYEAGVTFQASVIDGGSGRVNSTPTVLPTAGGTFALAPLNLSSLSDGSLGFEVTLTDVNGNVSLNPQGSGTKDTMAPTMAMNLGVPASAMNPINLINNQTSSAVTVDINYDPSMQGDETAVLVASGMVMGSPQSVSSAVVAVPASGGASSITGINTSSFDDGIMVGLQLTITDPAGNTSTTAGTSATYDISGPADPVSAGVVDTGGNMNPVNVINGATEGNVSVDVVLGATAQIGDVIDLTLSQGSLSTTAQSTLASAGAQTVSFTAIDASAFAEGAVAISVRQTDAQLNITDFTGTPAAKDTIAPATYTSALVIAGTQNPEGYINTNNEAAPVIRVTLPGGYAGDESLEVSLSDGGTTVTSASQPINADTTVIDVTLPTVAALNEGTLTLSVRLVDGSFNAMTYSNGTNPTKDTLPAVAPSSFRIPAAANCAQDFINNQTEERVLVVANYDGSMDGTEQATLSISGMVSGQPRTIMSGPFSVPASGGPFNFTKVDLSGFADGTITLSLMITDPAGNEATFAGTSATKDTAPPANPTSARIVDSGGSINPNDYINAASESSARVEVVTDTNAAIGDVVTVVLAVGSMNVSAQQTLVGAGVQTLSFPNLDVSAFPEGQVSVTVNTEDPSQNENSFTGMAATKDTVAPVTFTSASVVAGNGNPENFINSNSVSAPEVSMALPSSYDGTETAQVRLTNAGGNADSPAFNPAAGPVTFTAATASAAALNEGAVTIQLIVQDVAGNSATYSAATSVTKDTVAPADPTAVAVPVSANNPVNIVNNQTQSAATVSVTYAGSMAGDERATLRVQGASSGRSQPIVVGPQLVPSGGGAFSFGNLDVSGYDDGPVSLTIEIEDPAGNLTTFSGTTATKDVTAPDAPSSAGVVVTAPSLNPQDFINDASKANVSIDVAMTATALTNDVVRILLSSGASNFSAQQTLASDGAQTISFTGIDLTAFPEGSVVVAVEVDDPQLNRTSFAGTNAFKDTIAPVAPSVLQVASGMGNGTDIINLANVGATLVDVTYDAGMVGDESAVLTITSGAVVNSGSLTAPAGGGAVVLGPFDTTSLTDAVAGVVLALTLTDPAGNQTVANGAASATKDVVPPVAPTSAGVVDSGGSVNPINFVNLASQAIVAVDVVLPAGAVSGDTVQLVLTAGASSSDQTIAVASNGAQTITFNQDMSTWPEGPVSVQVTMRDVVANPVPFTGTSATLDRTPPSMPTFAGVEATANNPINFVNLASQSQVEVKFSFGASSVSSDLVTVDITDGASAMMSYGPSPAPDGAGDLAFVNQDFSGFADGTLTVSVSMADLAGNTATTTGNNATKDTSPPAAITAFAVAPGASNAANVVNAASVNAVQLDVTYPAGLAGDETIDLSVTSSGGGSFQLAPTNPASAGSISYNGNDFASVQDGNLTLVATVTDPAGNAVPFTGTAAVIDTTPPADPSSAKVMAGANNPESIINMVSVGAVSVQVDFSTFDVNDMVTVELDDGVTQVMAGPVASAASITFPSIDATSLLDQTMISVNVSIMDQYGNPSNAFQGTEALKDILPPALPSETKILAGAGNNEGYASQASQGSATIRVTLPASYVGTETLELTIDDNTATPAVAPTPTTAPASGGNVDFSGLNLSFMQDGSLDLNVTVSDENGNSATTTATGGKDTVAPSGFSSVGVAAGPHNSADWISMASQVSVQVDVSWTGAAEAGDTATAILSDGATTAQSFPLNAVPSGSATTATFSGAALADGALTLSLRLEDLAGNSDLITGFTASKDTVLPTEPVVDPLTSPTNKASANITGAAEADNSIEISDGTMTFTNTANSVGSFVVNVALAANTAVSLSVISIDTAGNKSAARTVDWQGQPLNITQDATAPDVPFSAGTSVVADTGSAAGGGFVDIDGDGDVDLFVGGAGRFYVNDGTGAYVDATASMGTLFSGDMSASFGDFDGDGDRDLFTTDSALGSFLYQNELIGLGSLTFTDATGSSAAGLGTDIRAGTWLDYNNDGFLDLFATDGDGFGNELLRNDGTGSFTNIFGSGLDTTVSDPRWICVGDLNGDRAIDVIVGDASPGLLFINNGAGSFTNRAGSGGGLSGFVTDTSTTEGGLAMGDIDNDGDLDIFVAGGGAGGTHQLWQNDGSGNFTDISATAGINLASGALDVVFGDFDNDSLLDIYAVGNGANVLFRNLGDQVGMDGIPEFANIAGATGTAVNDAANGRLAAAADTDNDGDLDLYVGNEMTANALFINTTNNQNFLKVLVQGKGGSSGGSTKDAIGARIRITDQGLAQDVMYRFVGSARGAGGSEPLVQHFGGIIPSRPYTVNVEWPDGTTTSITDVVPALAPNQTIMIIQP